MKAKLQEISIVQPSDVVSLPSTEKYKSSKTTEKLSPEHLAEEKKAFNSMIIALRDETKTELARQLGITHRFDYVTSEILRSVGESEKLRIVTSLDYETYSAADPFIALGQLSVMTGAALYAVGSILEVLASTAEISSLTSSLGTEADAGGFDGFEGLGDLGELALIFGAISLTVGVAKRIGKFFREHSLRRYQAEFKSRMEALTATFFAQGEEKAFRVPRLVIYALDLEQERMKNLLNMLQQTVIDSNPKSNVSRLALAATNEGYMLYSKMQQKFSTEINGLLQTVQHYTKSNRPDMAGVHLYVNKDVAFLPSQLSNEQTKEIQDVQNRLIKEVKRLSERSG